jgi:hypothetical protein
MFVPCSIPANSITFIKVLLGKNNSTLAQKTATSQESATFAIEGFSEEG